MSKSIVELVEGLPTENLTTKVLDALDFIVPGEWKNINNFDQMIAKYERIDNPQRIAKVRRRAIDIYEDKNNGYQTAVWLYQTVDTTDKAIAAAAIADKVGDTFRFVPFLDKLTPKSDTVQSLDLKIKLAAELIAYMKMNGISLNPLTFAQTVAQNYRKESLMRMAALVSFDAVLPLGPDFLRKIQSQNSEEEKSAIAGNAAIGAMKDLIPDQDPENFLNQTFNGMADWMDNLTKKFGLNQQMLGGKLNSFIEISDDKLDYLAAFIDGGVNYMEHTGIQTVARQVINRAHEQFKAEQKEKKEA